LSAALKSINAEVHMVRVGTAIGHNLPERILINYSLQFHDHAFSSSEVEVDKASQRRLPSSTAAHMLLLIHSGNVSIVFFRWNQKRIFMTSIGSVDAATKSFNNVKPAI
jgi:hypothetical protein